MRWLRRILLGLAGLVVFVVLLVVLAIGWFNTGPGQRQLAGLISDIASSEESGVQIGSISGFVPFDMTVGDVALSDTGGDWLTIDQASLDWAPFALVGGRLHVVSLDVGTVAMLREPAPSAAADDDEPASLEPPSLPFDIELDELSVGRVELPADLVGEAMAFTVTGDARLGEPAEGVQTDLTIDRLDGPPGHIGLNAAFVAGGRLTFDLMVDEPREGLIAGLAGWPLDVPVSVRLEGDGTLDSFAADLTASVGDLASANGSAAIEESDSGHTFNLSITSDAAQLMPADIQPLMQGPVVLDVSGSFATDGGVVLDRFDLNSAAGELAASGSLSAAGDLAGQVSLSAGASSLYDPILPGADWTELQLAATVGGTQQSPTVALTIDGDNFAIGSQGARQLSATINGTLPDGLGEGNPVIGFNLSLTAAGASLGDIDLDPLIETIDLMASGEVVDLASITLDSLSLTVPPGTLAGSGDSSLSGTDVSFDGQLTVPDTSVLAGITGLSLTGGLDTGITANLQGENFTVTLDATTSSLDIGVAEVATLLGDAWTLDLSAEGTLDGTISDATATIGGEAAEVTVAGSWDGSAFDATVSGSLPSIQPLVSSLDGEVDLQAAVQGSPDAFVAQVTANSPSFDTGGEVITDLSVSADLTGLPTAPEGTVDITGTAQGRPVSISVASSPVDTSGTSPIDLETVSLAFGAVRLDGAIQFDPLTLAATGQLTGGTGDLAELQDLHGQDLTGAASIDIELGWTEEGGQSADVEISGDEFAMPAIGEFGSLQISASGTDLLRAPGVDVTVALTDLSTATASLDSLNLHADGVDILGADGIELTGSAGGLSYPGVGTAETAEFDISATGLASVPEIDLTLDLTNIVVDDKPLGAATLTATVTDPAGDMSAVARIESDDADIDVTAGLTPLDDGTWFTLSAESEVRNLDDPDLAALTEEPVTLDVALLIGDDGSVTLDQANLAGGAGTVTASGGLAADSTIDATATIETDAPALVQPYAPGADWSDLAITVNVGGTLQSPTATVSVVGTDVAFADQQVAALNLSVDGSLPDGLGDGQPTIAFTTTLDASGVVLADPSLAPLAPNVSLSATGQVEEFANLTLSQLSLSAPVATVEGSGSATLDGSTASFDGTVDVADASLLSDISGQSLSGALNTAITLSVEGDTFTATVDATADGLALGEATVDGLLGDDWRLTVNADGSLSGTISDATIALAGAGAQINANGSWDGETVAAETVIALDNISALAAGLDGSIDATASINGTLEALAAQISLTSSALDASGESVEDLTLDANVTGIPSAITGSVDLTGSIREQPVSVSLNARPLDPSGTSPIDLETVNLQFGALQLGGTLQIDPVTLAAIGQLTGGVDDLAALQDLHGQEIAGQASIDLELDWAEDSGQSADLEVTASQLAVLDILNANSLQISASGTDLLGAPGVDVSVDASGLSTTDASIESLSLSADGIDIMGADGIELAGSANGVSFTGVGTTETADFDITATGLASVPEIDLTIDLTDLVIDNQALGAATLMATVTDPGGDMSVLAEVQSDDADINANAQLVAVDGGTRLTLSAQSEVRNLDDPDLVALTAEPVTVDVALVIGDDGSLTLDRAELNGAVGTLTASGSLAADGTIDANIAVETGASALVRSYVPDADWTDLTINVDAGGTMESPTASVLVVGTDITAAGQQVGNLSLTLDGSLPDGLGDSQPTIAFSTTLDATGVVLADQTLAPLATSVNLTAAGQVENLSALTLSQLSLTVPAATVAGTGSAAFDASSASFDGTVDVTDASLLSGLTGQSMSGALNSAIVLSVDQGAFTASVDATADGLALGDAMADGLLGDAWHLVVDADGALDGTISDATIALTGSAAQINADGNWDGENIFAETDVSIDSLATLAPDLDGSVQATASLSGPIDALAAQVSLTSTALNASGESVEDLTLNADLTGIPSAITGAIDLTGSVRDRPVALSIDARPLDPSGESPIDLETVNLQFGSLELGGTIRFDPTTLAAIGSLEGEVDDLSSLDALSDQPVSGSATLAITLDNTEEAGQSASLRVTGNALAFGDIATASSLQVTAEGTDLLGSPGLDLTAVAESLEATDIAIETLTLTANGDDILGSDGIRLQGSAAGLAYADLVMASSMDFDVTGRDLAEAAVIDADIDATSLEVAGQRFGSAAIAATLNDPAGDLSFDATVDANSALVGGLDFSSLRVTAAGTPEEMDWSVDGQQSGAAVSGAGQIAIADTIAIALQSLSLSASGESFALASPSTITIQENGTVDLGSLALSAAGGSLSVSGTVADTLNLNVGMSDLPLRLIALVAPGTEITGVINGTAAVTGSASAPQGQFDLRASGVGTPETESLGLGSYNASVSGTLTGTTTEFTGEISGNGSQLSLSGSVPTGGGGSVQVSGQGSFDLAVLNPLLAAGADTVTGTLAVDLSVSGSMSELAGSGTITLRNGSYRNALYGVALTGIEIDMSASTDELVVTRLVGQTPNGGRLGGSGRVILDPSRGLPVEITLQADDAAVIDMPSVAASADMDLTFSGSLAQGGTLDGRVNLRQVEARLDNLGTASVPTIDVIEINPSTPEEAERIERARAAAAGETTASVFDIQMNVEVVAANQVFVRGSGLEAEFSGDLLVTGSLNQPAITGTLDLRRGSYNVLNRNLQFTQGTIRFDGRPIDPQLDFQASVTVDDVVATLAVVGRASDPRISVSSQPELPQSEVLALIIFGRATESLSPFEAVQLAASAGQLAGIGGSGPGLMEEVRQTLGIDRVDFTTNAAGETAIGLGQNITDNIYVEVDQGVETGSSEVSVQIELTPNITLESGVGTEGSRVGVSVEWNY
ncbi:MAG: translocation/assembly module TamB domain-containing protein [Pseudomonadota bacterium]